MEWLGIYCKIGDEGVIAMTSCIDKVERLSIGYKVDNELTITGIRALWEAVQKLRKPVSM